MVIVLGLSVWFMSDSRSLALWVLESGWNDASWNLRCGTARWTADRAKLH